jgi:hypothetical protein
MTDDLVAFLRARLDEDEAAARAVQPDPRMSPRDPIEFILANQDLSLPSTEAAEKFIVSHTPARVLAEVEAKRRIIDDLIGERHDVVDGDCWYCCPAATEERDGGQRDDDRLGKPCDCGRDARLLRRLRLLALPYANRPGYKDEWATS